MRTKKIFSLVVSLPFLLAQTACFQGTFLHSKNKNVHREGNGLDARTQILDSNSVLGRSYPLSAFLSNRKYHKNGKSFSVTLIDHQNGNYIEARFDGEGDNQTYLNVTKYSRQKKDSLSFDLKYKTNRLALTDVKTLSNTSYLVNYVLQYPTTDKSSSDSEFFNFNIENSRNYIVSENRLEMFTGYLYDNKGNKYTYIILNDPFDIEVPLGTLPYLVYFSTFEMEEFCERSTIDTANKYKTKCWGRVEIDYTWVPWKKNKCLCNITCK